MKRTFINKGIFACIATLLTIASSFAQTITTSAVSPTAVCAGSTASIAFTTTGAFSAGIVFTAQLSDATGAFTAPVSMGTDTATPISITIPSATIVGTGYKVRVVAGTTPVIIGSASAVFTINAIPAAPVIVNKNYAAGDTAVSLASSVTGTGLLWYTAATGGTGSAIAPKPSTAVAGTVSYYVSQTSTAGCESAREKIDVVVSAAACTPPAAPTVTNKSYTVGDVVTVTLTASGATGATFKWYDSATSTTTLASAPVPSTTTVGTKSYFVTQTVSSCESARAEIVVTVNACTPPAAPKVADISYTVGAAAKELIATGTDLKWYTTATGGTGSSTAPIPSTATAGTKSYFVTQTVASCESARAEIVVTVSACVLSAAPTVTSPVSYCASTTPIAVLVATGTAIQWYNEAGAKISAPKPDVNVSTTTTYIYFVTQTQTGKCESAKKEVEINVYKTAAPKVSADPIEYCLKEEALPLTATGTLLKWYTTATGGTGTSTPLTPVTTTAGTKSYYVTQTLNDCESDRAEIKIITKAISVLPTIASDTINLCQNSTAITLIATGTTGAVFKWYTVATGGTALASAPVPVTTAAGSISYYVSQISANSCEGLRVKVTVIIKDTPKAPTVTPVSYCIGETALPLTPVGPLYKWYTAATGGTGSLTSPTPQTTTAGTTSFYLTQSNTYGTLSCESPRAKLDVVVNPRPAVLKVTDAVVCQELTSKTYTFPITADTGNKIRWYITANGTDTTKTTPSVNLTVADTTIYYATQLTAKGCESPVRAIQKIRVKPLPGKPGVSDIEYCQFVKASPLTATWVTGATPNWYGTSATGGTATTTAPTPSTSEGNTTTYYVGQTLEGCVGDRAKIAVKINTTPVPATTTYFAYCQGETAPILDATGTILKWYRAATDTEFQGYPYTPFTDKVEDYSFYVTQTGTVNGCESPKEEIKIHIKALPSATISGNATIDLGQTANITLKFTGDGPWIYVLSNGTTDTTDQATTTIAVTPGTTTTYIVTEVSNACGKGTPNGSALVTVKIPTLISGIPSVSEACAGKNFSVPFQQSGDFPAGNMFKVQISLVNADASFYTIPSIATSNLVTATFPDTTKGGNYFVRVVSTGDNPDLVVKGSVSPIGIAASPLPVATLTGSQTVLMGESATLKAEFTGRSPWSFILNNGTSDTLITASTTPYSFKITVKTTTTYTISSVSNGCGQGKGAGSARVQVDPVLGIEPPVSASDWLNVYPTVVEGQCTIEIKGSVSSKEANVQIIDMNGRPVHNQLIRQKITGLDFSRYPSGLYLLRVQNGNFNSVRKVMKP